MNFAMTIVVWIMIFYWLIMLKLSVNQTLTQDYYSQMNTLLILQIGYSSPTQSGIMRDLNLGVAQVWTFVFLTFITPCCWWPSFDWLCLLTAKLFYPMQYSIFGSILTIGAMIGAVVSGRIADYAGRRVVSQSIAA